MDMNFRMSLGDYDLMNSDSDEDFGILGDVDGSLVELISFGSVSPIANRTRPMSARSLASLSGEDGPSGVPTLRNLVRLEQKYESEIEDLRCILTDLKYRRKMAWFILESSAPIGTDENRSIDQIERDIGNAENVLLSNSLDLIGNANDQDLSFVQNLERINQERHRLHAPTKISSRISAQLDRFPSISSTPITPGNVRTQIDNLIQFVNDCRDHHKRALREIDELDQRYAERRQKSEHFLKSKEDKISQLESDLNKIREISAKIQELEEIVKTQRLRLKELKWSRERIERMKYTAARDAHANSEIARQVAAQKNKYEARLICHKVKADSLAKRAEILKTEEERLDKHNEVVDKYEGEIQNLEDKQIDLGKQFSGAICDSQGELETMYQLGDLVGQASDHSRISLEGELSGFLRESFSASGDGSFLADGSDVFG
jgi:DNA repair exonuclease SbcCD ATPase subunit